MSAVDSAVQALLQARRSGQAVPAPGLPDAAAAYAVQDGVAQALGWFGDVPPLVWKSGGPSRQGVQTHAPLPGAGVWTSPADASRQAFHQRGIEAEVALRLQHPVDAATAAGIDVDGARALVDVMAVTIEVVDSRWTEAGAAPALAKLADLQSHGALVIGDWAPYDPAHDWTQQVCTVRIGTGAPQRFVGTHSMGDPAWVLPAWLRHLTRHGGTVRAGTLVTTGTWCGLLQAQPGDEVEVRFDGIGAALLRF